MPHFHDLGNSLYFMHSFKIVHGDIKPQNIMWSPQFNKLVFIDFGLTKTLRENVGELSETKFFGTYHYASE